jgi:hypothetical protein
MLLMDEEKSLMKSHLYLLRLYVILLLLCMDALKGKGR